MPISSGRSVEVESWIWFRGKVQLLQLTLRSRIHKIFNFT